MSSEDLKYVSMEDFMVKYQDNFLFGSKEDVEQFRMQYLTSFEHIYNYLAEAKWSKRIKHRQVYSDFRSQLISLELAEINTQDSDIHLKMRLSYAVTLMESCLSEMLKSVALQYENFRRNAVNNISEIKSAKINAALLLDKDPKEIIDSLIMGHLSYILYHNIDKVKKVYSQVLGDDFPEINEDVDKKIFEIMDLRHDIAHRNGKKISGEIIGLTPEMVSSCILIIRQFVEGVHNFIIKNVGKDSKKIA